MTRGLLHRAFVSGKAARLVHGAALANLITICAILAWLVLLGSSE